MTGCVVRATRTPTDASVACHSRRMVFVRCLVGHRTRAVTCPSQPRSANAVGHTLNRQSAFVGLHKKGSMQFSRRYEPCQSNSLRKSSGYLLSAAAVLMALFAAPRSSAAAELSLAGSGSFKPPTKEVLAALPADLVFSRADLASGRWSFSARYETTAPDGDPDPHVGRYTGAIRSFRLVIGATAIDLPADQAEVLVSDGGGGFVSRESIRLQGRVVTSAGVVRLSWIQANQQPAGTDLQGASGSLASDSLPPVALLANLPTASPFDRFLELRIDPPGSGPRPLLYLSSSTLSVTADSVTAP